MIQVASSGIPLELAGRRRRGITGSSSGTATFSPNSIAGLVSWYKADAGTSTTTDGVALSGWNDQSASAINLAQATGVNQPVYKAAQQNGLPGVLFSATDFMDAAAVNVAQPDTVFITLKLSGTGNQNFIDGTTSRQVVFVDTLKWNYFAGVQPAAVGTADLLAHTFSAIFNGASSQLWLDGTSISTSNPSTNALTGLRVGASNAAVSPVTGLIFELLVYNSSLSVANRQSVESYLRTKWGTP